MTPPPPPLANLTVLEISDGVAAAYAGRLLATYGARVILIESPTGSPLRAIGPFPLSSHSGLRTEDSGLPGAGAPGAVFLTLARGKESTLADLETAEGRAAFEQLLAGADILLTDQAQRLEKLGFGYEALAVRYPQLVYTSASAFGDSGPYANYAADAATVYALGGYTFVTGEPDREPIQGPEYLPAYTAGANTYTGTLAAVWARNGTGKGQRVEVSEMESLVAGHQFTVSRYSYEEYILRRSGNRYAGIYALVNFYQALDGVIAMSAAATPMMNVFLQVIGRDDLLGHANPDPTSDFAAFDRELTPWFAERTRAEIAELCQTVRVPAAPAYEVDELLNHAQLLARHWWQPSTDPETPNLKFPGPPFRMLPPSTAAAGEGLGVREQPPSRAPHLGENQSLRNSNHSPSPLSVPQDSRSPLSVPQEWRGAGGEVAPAAPLAGIRILDLTRVWAGPLGTRMLADLGAEVVKIEAPTSRGGGVPTRGGGDGGADPWNRNSNFNDLNRNKLSLTLDLAQPEGKEIVRALVADADIVIENYSPRVMGNLGLSYEELSAINPRIIMVSMPGYGLDGPMRDYVAFGTSLDAESGTATLMGYPGEGPERLGVAFPDHVAAVHAAGAVITALLAREATGPESQHGTHVELAQFESMTTFVADQVVAAQIRGGPPPRIGNRYPTTAPRGVFPCAGDERWISIGVHSDEAWRAIAEIIGRPGLAERFATNALRLQHQAEIEAIITTWTRAQEPNKAMQLLQSKGIAAGVASDAPGLFNDPHLRARGFYVTQEHPSAGTHDLPGLPIRLSETPVAYTRPAPKLGQHNRMILQDWLHYTNEQIADLEAKQVIAERPPTP